MLFESGSLDPERLRNERTRKVLWGAIDRAQDQLRASDLLAAAIASADPKILAILAQALPPGSSPSELLETIDVYSPARTTPADFDGARARISAQALAALDEFDAALINGPVGTDRVALELLTSCVLAHLEEPDREYLSAFNAEQAVAQLRERIKTVAEPPVPLFDADSGRLRSEVFTDAAWAALEASGV